VQDHECAKKGRIHRAEGPFPCAVAPNRASASAAGGLVGCRRYGVDQAGECDGGDGEDRDCDDS